MTLPSSLHDDIVDLPPFYVVGGTMPRSALSYVERQADHDLHAWLRAGEFCYVLTSRQMGKSSLMVRTASYLRLEAGMAVASIDLTSVGQNLSVEQWYLGMLRRIGRQLDLEDEIDDFWKREQSLGPLQRWLAALSDVVLASCSEKIVIFVDEIDVVRSLPFPTDEFFAAIRDCYNRRSSEPEFRRLTFCLLGVATPSHLIDDPHLTPFNIGRRVELRDFTSEDAAPLASGLLQPGLTGPVDQVRELLLERILYWTGGHPYLTQRFCQAVAAERGTRTIKDVDRICGEIFLGHGAEEKDDNLLFVRERLLRGAKSGAELSNLLRLYAGIRAGRRVEEDANDNLITSLRLSGITRVEMGMLRVRNRIYEHVFDREWVTAHLPDAELRRHRMAFRSGVRRTLLLSGLVMSVVLVLAWTALLQAKRATQREQEQRRLLFWADMKIAEQALEQQNVGLATQILSEHRDDAVHNFVWGYLWKQCHNKSLQLPHKDVGTASFSPDNRYVALGTRRDGTIRLCDSKTGAEHRIFRGKFQVVSAVAFSPDGARLAASSSPRGGSKSEVQVWSLATGRLEHIWPVPYSVASLRVTADSRSVQANSLRVNEQSWDLQTGRAKKLSGVSAQRGNMPDLVVKENEIAALSADGKVAAISSSHGPIRFVDTRIGRETSRLGGNDMQIRCLAFSSDSRLLAQGGDITNVWNILSQQETKPFRLASGSIRNLVFSSDGKQLVTVNVNGDAKIWNLKRALSGDSNVYKPEQIVSLQGFKPDPIQIRFAFSPDTSLAVSRPRYGNEFSLWETKSGRRRLKRSVGEKVVQQSLFRPNGHDLLAAPKLGPMQVFDLRSESELINPPERAITGYTPLAYSPDGQWFATKLSAPPKQGGRVFLQNILDPSRSYSLEGHKPQVISGAFSSDGRLLATGSWDMTARIWDTSRRKPLQILRGHRGPVQAVAFASDGVTLATASGREIRFWDISLGRETLVIDTGDDTLAALAFTPDGLELKAAFGDGTIRSWFASPKQDINRLTATVRPQP